VADVRAKLKLAELEVFPASGRVVRMTSAVVEADGPDLSVGDHCEIIPAAKNAVPVRARVVAVSDAGIRLAPFHSVAGLRLGDRVMAASRGRSASTGNNFAGRAINALGEPIDGEGPIAGSSGAKAPLPVLERASPSRPLATGIRVLDGLLTVGHGQRMGIFAAAGVGKSRLVEQISRQSQCDRVVVCLVGERGREVEAFWQDIKVAPRRDRFTVVAATSDELAPMRVQAVEQALALTEFWREQGEDVLLIVDSVTRYAMALREIGLLGGEPPTLRSYTPNIFRELPIIVERCGAQRGKGTITAFFTVLSENDDVDDPLVEVVKSLLDGHVVLSRRLAQAGHFPAVDIARSVSRLFDKLVDRAQSSAASQCRMFLARYEESRILIESGMYRAGTDRELDTAIAARSAVNAFSQQGSEEFVKPDRTREELLVLVPGGAMR